MKTMIRVVNSLFAKPAQFFLAGVGIALATTIVTTISLYQMRLDAMAQACDATQNLAMSVQKETEHTLDLYQRAMWDIMDGAETSHAFNLPPEVEHRLAFRSARSKTGPGVLFATDAKGNLVLDSRSVVPRHINVSDRDFFQVQQRRNDAGVYLSRPMLARADDNEPSIALSLRLEDSQRRFAGIVAGTLRLSYFRELFDGSILGRHGTITLMRTDGTVLMRHPYKASDIGISLAGAGNFRALAQSDELTYVNTAVIDHVQRLYSTRRIGPYPLVVVVGLATDDIYAEWRKRAMTIGIVTAILDVIFILLSLLFSRQLQKRLTMERQLQRLAWFDTLTGLPNRAGLQRETRRILMDANRKASSVATLFVDLDRFKRVNDTQGHSVGDEALKEIARRLRDQLRSEGVIGRLGGDEFLALLPNCNAPRAAYVAERILQAVYQPVVINSAHDIRIMLGASIGISLYPRDGLDAETLLRKADIAMYHAKSAGRNQVRFHAPEYERQAKEDLELEIALQRALQEKTLRVAYQPKVDASGALRGAEALVRWYHDKQGFISPDYFIAIAEEGGLIAELDAWVLGEACRQLAEWRDHGLGVPHVSVNVCAADFKRPDYPEFIAATLEAHGLKPGDLILEMTERVVFDESADDIRSSLDAIHALGIGLSIDDFGTGYSSLSYLHRLPFKELKIDKSFVRGIGGNSMAESLAKSVINLGNVLDMTVTAEGVETTEQRDFLNRHGCHLYQGYLFSPPMPPADFAAWIEAHPQRTLPNEPPPSVDAMERA